MKDKLREIIGQAVGEASMLWINDKGEFDSTRGIKIVEETINEILALVKECVPTENNDEIWEHEQHPHYGDGFNACRQQFLANVEGEE